MPRQTPPVWTTGRQLAVNLLPILAATPFLVLAVREASRDPLTLQTLGWTLAFFATGWLMTNLLGLIGNGGIKRQMELRFLADHPGDKRMRVFVGFARPSYKGLLDPHEDVGFLLVSPESITFQGAVHQFSVPTVDVQTVRFRPNAHSWLLLGRWIAIEAEVGGRNVALHIEPREKATLLGNRRLGKRLAADLRALVASSQKTR